MFLLCKCAAVVLLRRVCTGVLLLLICIAAPLSCVCAAVGLSVWGMEVLLVVVVPLVGVPYREYVG